uniref:Uncharacterized protein n=1 Tax=viral metagenome TaxID=1070528 RepID=A0A6C0HSW2_9ZZZZ
MEDFLEKGQLLIVLFWFFEKEIYKDLLKSGFKA